MMNKKGNAEVLLVTLIGLVLVGTAYLIGTQLWNPLYDATTSNLSGKNLETAQKLDNVWNSWPIFAVVLMLFFAILATLRSSQSELI